MRTELGSLYCAIIVQVRFKNKEEVMEFAWEEVLNAILRLPVNMRFMEMQEFLHRWVDGASCKMYEEELGMKKVLDSEITQNEIDTIFENSGYVLCNTCREIVEDDHECTHCKRVGG